MDFDANNRRESISEIVIARVSDSIKNLKKSLNEIFPLNQVPTNIMSPNDEHNIYKSSMPSIIIGFSDKSKGENALIQWEAYWNSNDFYVRFDYSFVDGTSK